MSSGIGTTPSRVNGRWYSAILRTRGTRSSPTQTCHVRAILARDWEFRLRKEIFWGRQMSDDRVILPYFDVAHVYRCSGWGVEVEHLGGENGGAYRWDSPIRSEADIDRLHPPEITVEDEATERVLALAHELFDGRWTSACARNGGGRWG